MSFTRWDSIKECLLSALFAEVLGQSADPASTRPQLRHLLDELRIEGPERFRLERLLCGPVDPFQSAIYESELHSALFTKACRRMALAMARRLDRLSLGRSELLAGSAQRLRQRVAAAGRDTSLLHRAFNRTETRRMVSLHGAVEP